MKNFHIQISELWMKTACVLHTGCGDGLDTISIYFKFLVEQTNQLKI